MSPTTHLSESAIWRFQSTLLDWYRAHGRHFAWRESSRTEYELVIAETLLQRTKAENVAKHYDRFTRTFPSWEALVNAGQELLAHYLQPLGLATQRAKRLHGLAVEMVRRGGILPRDRAELESIPFFGQYIANAVELVIFGRPAPLLDVNMARVLERYFGPRKLADIRYDPYLQELAQRVAAHPLTKHLNWAILDFAALVCKALRPRCPDCPLNRDCCYYEMELAYLT